MEKPVKAAVGQLWRSDPRIPGTRIDGVVTRVHSGGVDMWSLSNGPRTATWPERELLRDLEYLGTSQTQPAPPFNCADCGYAGYGTECPACAPPQKATPEVRQPVAFWNPQFQAANSGQFYGPGIADMLTAQQRQTGERLGAEPRDELARLRQENEMLHRDLRIERNAGDKMIATLKAEVATLKAEVATLRQPYTRKKKPEPWVPSIDPDWDLYV